MTGRCAFTGATRTSPSGPSGRTQGRSPWEEAAWEHGRPVRDLEALATERESAGSRPGSTHRARQLSATAYDRGHDQTAVEPSVVEPAESSEGNRARAGPEALTAPLRASWFGWIEASKRVLAQSRQPGAVCALGDTGRSRLGPPAARRQPVKTRRAPAVVSRDVLACVAGGSWKADRDLARRPDHCSRRQTALRPSRQAPCLCCGASPLHPRLASRGPQVLPDSGVWVGWSR